MPISGSCGQLLVYVYAVPGRSVAHDHDVQKKNAVSGRSRDGSFTAASCSAYASRSVASDGSPEKSPA